MAFTILHRIGKVVNRYCCCNVLKGTRPSVGVCVRMLIVSPLCDGMLAHFEVYEYSGHCPLRVIVLLVATVI